MSEEKIKGYFKELSDIHNRICCRKANNDEFKEKLQELLDSGLELQGYNGILGVVASRFNCTMDKDYGVEYEDFDKLCWQLIHKFNEEDKSGFGIFVGIKYCFMETVLEKKFNGVEK